MLRPYYNLTMTTAPGTLADKLLSEGERTLTFFRSLPAERWCQQVYGEGPGWTVRDTFEHLVISEQELLRLFQRIVHTGLGVDDGFSFDHFNAEHTGELAMLGWDDLQARYRQTRQRTADFTRSLSDEQLAVRARHPALGISTLEEMIKLIYVHHSLHVRDVRRQ
jgi:hypothetical protein